MKLRHLLLAAAVSMPVLAFAQDKAPGAPADPETSSPQPSAPRASSRLPEEKEAIPSNSARDAEMNSSTGANAPRSAAGSDVKPSTDSSAKPTEGTSGSEEELSPSIKGKSEEKQ
jgi:hypothetical protein